MAKVLLLLVMIAAVSAIAIGYNSFTGQVASQENGAEDAVSSALAGCIPQNVSGNIQDSYLSSMVVLDILSKDGINSSIVAGNPLAEPANFTDVSRMWLMAKPVPGVRLAVDPAACRVAREDEGNYYKGFMFSSPEHASRFVSLYSEYSMSLSRSAALNAEYQKCAAEFQLMTAGYNAKYGGKPLTAESSEARSGVFEKQGGCNAISGQLGSEMRSASYAAAAISNLLQSSSMKL